MDIKVKNAIISVSDKTGLIEMAKNLDEMGVAIYSTGGTARALENAGVPVVRISDYTGFPEILDGRVKSLHPRIHGGILARRDDDEHLSQLQENGIVQFDLVVINLYPFRKVVAGEGVGMQEAIENIDIGGPSMLRSAAKNFEFACVVADPRHYEQVIDEMKERGGVSLATRKKLALEVFETTASYDSYIAGYFHSVILEKKESEYPDTINLLFSKKQSLRYGENPHQSAAFYTSCDIRVTGVSTARQLHGKELSFNNILDIEAAAEIVKEFDEPACSVIKHTNPCGAASARTLKQALLDAWDSDPVSAFGSIVGFNETVDPSTAEAMAQAGFVECVVAPGYEDEAFRLLENKKNLRILATGTMRGEERYDYDLKRVIGGVLVQERDLKDADPKSMKIVTEKKPGDEELDSLLFAWKVVKHVKSNAIVLARGTKTVGVGAGQMSRVDSTFMAITKAKGKSSGAVLASDAFFPKTDAVQLAADHGITAIIQPGGSVADEEVIALCNARGIAMVCTGMRHFKH